MNAIPTAANGGLLAYLLAALVLVAMAALSRPRCSVALDTPGPHKNNPGNVSILAESDVTGANPTPNKEKDMTETTRLYRLEVAYPAAALTTDGALDPDWVPDTFTPTEQVPAFYWPKTDRIYKSRSAATDRAALLRRYGCTVTILEATPAWENIPTANARRHRERTAATIRHSIDSVFTDRDQLGEAQA
ncbi:Uncharacterised protein [Acidipropionibacterium jensenii]|uniref:Uncharacterized protein n=1 Tax=Acidipropionibacterium jensenii TaxID=1749 RepID=A0A448P190_9ACTN|nr:hypothetical protein [Acidipropionibacterium jensenii]VEI03926.1 Uncharacterised protein [Acidipropionibacterium jensenii]